MWKKQGLIITMSLLFSIKNICQNHPQEKPLMAMKLLAVCHLNNRSLVPVEIAVAEKVLGWSQFVGNKSKATAVHWDKKTGEPHTTCNSRSNIKQRYHESLDTSICNFCHKLLSISFAFLPRFQNFKSTSSSLSVFYDTVRLVVSSTGSAFDFSFPQSSFLRSCSLSSRTLIFPVYLRNCLCLSGKPSLKDWARSLSSSASWHAPGIDNVGMYCSGNSIVNYLTCQACSEGSVHLSAASSGRKKTDLSDHVRRAAQKSWNSNDWSNSLPH